MSDELNIVLVAGTSRPGRKSIHAARLIESVGKQIEGIKITFIDVAEMEMPYDGKRPEDKDPHFTKATAEADGFFIVVPEYNHGYPGSLKRVLDSEFANYKHKAVALAGVSSGPWGGVRAIENISPVLREMNLAISGHDLHFPNVSDVFNDEGELQDEAYIERIKKTYAELIWWTKATKWGRKNLVK